MIEVILSVLLVIGGVFGLIGSYGLLRLKLPMQRLHSTTKASTVGVGDILIASMIQNGGQSWHEVLITVFLFATAPITAIYLARTHLTSQDLPPTGNDSTWSQVDRNTE
jgi:multicomponent K+:H+ antiporter subunit G